MQTLLNNELAPLTFSWGFLESPLEPVTSALTRWRESHSSSVSTQPVFGTLREALVRLQPLSIPPTKELILSTKSSWTAYFDNGVQGGEPTTAVGYLAEALACRGVAVACIPQSAEKGEARVKAVYGAVMFDLFGPEQREFLNYERSVGIMNDGGRWVFVNRGTPQPFEKLDNYHARRLRERFSSELLEQYCAAMGIDLFDPEFYGPIGVIVSMLESLSKDAPKLSLPEARSRLGLAP
jgi:hypothetical protein